MFAFLQLHSVHCLKGISKPQFKCVHVNFGPLSVTFVLPDPECYPCCSWRPSLSMDPRFRFYHPCCKPFKILPTGGSPDELKARPAEENDWTIYPYSLRGKQLQCIGLQVAQLGSCCPNYASEAADGFDLAAMLESVASVWALCKPTHPTEGEVHMFENMALIPVSGFNPKIVQVCHTTSTPGVESGCWVHDSPHALPTGSHRVGGHPSAQLRLLAVHGSTNTSTQ